MTLHWLFLLSRKWRKKNTEWLLPQLYPWPIALPPLSVTKLHFLMKSTLQSYLKLQPVLVTCPSSLHSQKVTRTVNLDYISPLLRSVEELCSMLI